jgi:hypothetical protein
MLASLYTVQDPEATAERRRGNAISIEMMGCITAHTDLILDEPPCELLHRIITFPLDTTDKDDIVGGPHVYSAAHGTFCRGLALDS